jgi:hypothetical protein
MHFSYLLISKLFCTKGCMGGGGESPPSFSSHTVLLQLCRYSDRYIVHKAVSETTNRQIESVNRERESVATLLFLGNLVIDDNLRISNNLGLGLAANISSALAIQPDRDRE